MAHLEREPFFTLNREWSDHDHHPEKIKFKKDQGREKGTVSGTVSPDHGKNGIEWTIGVTLTEFKEVQNDFKFSNHEKWAAFRKCLGSTRLVAWDNLVASEYPDTSTRTTEEFKVVFDKWVTKIESCPKGRDVQYRYLSDKTQCRKARNEDCNAHRQRWEEIM